jgi:hypothetical protein
MPHVSQLLRWLYAGHLTTARPFGARPTRLLTVIRDAEPVLALTEYKNRSLVTNTGSKYQLDRVGPI